VKSAFDLRNPRIQIGENNKAMRRAGLIFSFVVALLLAACGGEGAGAGDPAETVERYLQAKVESDAAAIQALLCSEMESVLDREVHTFDSVSEVRLEEAACEQEGDSSTVRCQGRIVALYGTEQTEFPLTAYRVVEEDGEWKWCGEAP
jgi:hypothetical protein